MDKVDGPPHLGSIRFITGPLYGQTFQITRVTTTIGRDDSNDIVIPDPSVSRYHARLVWSRTSWSIEKVRPNNTITLNQAQVQQAQLKDHDTIGLGGKTTFLFIVTEQGQNVVPTRPADPPIQAQNPAEPQRPAGLQSPIEPTRAAPPPPRPDSQRPTNLPKPPAPYPPPIAVALPQAQAQPEFDGTIAAQTGRMNAPTGIPSLEISTNTRQETYTYQLIKPVINIGRDATNDIVINEPTISSFHVQIVREGDQLVLVHPHPARAQTVNGLLYQGHKIAGNQSFRKALKRGDIFRIGDEHGALVTLTFNDGTGTVQEIIPELRPIPLREAVITIGRLPDNMVVLNHPQVSGQHARLERVQETYRIVDMGSTNHVYVNAERVREQKLKPGDEVRIGPFKLTYTGTQLTQQDESNSIRIDALHLKKVGNRKTILLNDISVAIPPRSFVALVGGSGAGKSTLMDALNGLRPAQQGVVLYNKQDYYRNLAAFSTQLGYVPQEDIVHRDLSVERVLYYAARLRLPTDFTRAQIKQRIDEVLDDVEMKHRRKLLVRKLSGGQRKRVSIALELLANPSVFFLDEPTSGLDPGLDRKMMFLLRRLADRGHTIVLVTHATSNINACDYICFLAQGGRLAYYGPPNEARTFFGKTSFAEIYSALEPTEEHPEIPDQAEAAFKSSPDYQRYVADPLNQEATQHPNASEQTAAITLPKRGNPWIQFLLLSMRYIELLKNDVGNLLILLLQAPIIALILMFLVGPKTFEASHIAVCPTRANILTTTGPIISTDCQRVLDFLTNTQQGQAFTAQQNKTPIQALQDFFVFNSGGDAEEVLFIMAFAAVMFGCINAAREIVKEGPIYKRERTVNLGIAPYMFSKCAVLGALCLLQSAILVLMINLQVPFHQGIVLPVTLEVYITLALTSLAGLMLGLAISTIVPNTDRAMSFVPIVLIPQVIFSGVIFPLNGTGTQVLGALFAARWANAALGSSVGLHGDKLNVDNFSYCGTLFSTCTQSQAMSHLLIAWGALVVMILAFGCLVAFFLKRKDIRA